MKRKLIGLTLTIFILTGMNVFGQVQWCDIDFGCFLTDDWKPTLPPSGSCHATTPDLLKLYARSCWSDGRDCPINWGFQLQAFDYNTDDCYINGCHQHARVFDPSHYQNMLTSSGGIGSESRTFSNFLNREDIAFFAFDVAKPEASGSLYLIIKASIPSGCIRSKILECNPGWRFENDDPNANWIWTTMALPYHIDGLIELADGDDYIKNAPINNHVAHNQYGTPDMNRRLQNFASAVRTQYRDNNSAGNYYVRISFNDLSLQYGGIFDYNSQWDCDHIMHRVGQSVDLNTTVCLTCDSGQQGCVNKSSLNNITLRNADGTTETLTVKEWIDRLAQDQHLNEWHPGTTDRRIHLDIEPRPGR